MTKRKAPTQQVEESTAYENLVDKLEEYKANTEDSLPEVDVEEAGYPKKLRVHIELKKHANSFAKLLKRSLSSDKTEFVFTAGVAGKTTPDKWVFTDKRKKRSKKTIREPKREVTLWVDMVEFTNEAKQAFITFDLTFRTPTQFVAFARLVKQNLGLETQYIWYPGTEKDDTKRHWISKFDDHQPRYPIYIVSKGRADSRQTAKSLEKMGVPYSVVIEPQDYDAYS